MYAIFFSVIVNAQKTDNFFSDVAYKVSLGIDGRYSSAPFDQGKIGVHLGVDALKPIESFFNEKIDVYGLLGLHFVQKGGKQSSNLFFMLEDGNSFGINQLSIPIHGGIAYNFSKCNLFFDFGPYLAFGVGGSDFDGFVRKSVDFGVGFNLGLQFKRFGLGFGYDKGFTNIAEYEVLYENNATGSLMEGEKFNLKSQAVYITLSWTFGQNK